MAMQNLSIYLYRIDVCECMTVNLANAAQWHQHRPLPKSMKDTIAYVDNNAVPIAYYYYYYSIICTKKPKEHQLSIIDTFILWLL